MYIVGIDIGKIIMKHPLFHLKANKSAVLFALQLHTKVQILLWALSSKTSVIPLVYLAWKLQVITGIPFIHF